jgi:hypothetical protein
MAACQSCPERHPSLHVAQWQEMVGLPADCTLTPAQAGDVAEALRQADEDVALYAGWWPLPTQVCEEIRVAIRYGGCFFARAGLSRWVTLRFGKVQRIERVEFLHRPGSCTPGVDCYVAAPGAICIVDSQYGSVELDVRSTVGCGCPADIERVRIRYVSGDGCEVDDAPRFARLLACYAATLLPSPHLCGLDLRFDDWDSYTLSESETEHTQEDIFGSDLDLNDRTITDRTLTKSKEGRLPQNPQDYQCPFGPTRAGVQLWRYLKSRRRLRAYRL